MKLKMIDDNIHRLWSFQASMFFFVLNGAVASLAAFTDKIDPWTFLYLNVGGYGLIGLLRLIKQAPPVDAEPATEAKEPWLDPAVQATKPAAPQPSAPQPGEPSAQEIVDALRQLLKQQSAPVQEAK